MDEQALPSTAAARTDLRLMNTKIAADNALVAWTNMTISLIGFGFAIYEILQQSRVKGIDLPRETPRNVGLFFVAVGTIGLFLGMASYLQRLRQLRRLHRFGFVQPPLIVALLVAGLGVYLIVNIATRIS